MNDEKRKIEIIFQSEEFNNSNKFEKEKKYAFARFYYSYIPFMKHLFRTEEYREIERLTTKYSNSILSKIKEGYKNDALPKEYLERLKKDIIIVPVIIRNVKSGKERTIYEPMIPDSTLTYFEAKTNLKFYLSKLKEYKQVRDEGKKQFLVLDYGKEYSSKEEFRNIKMLIETTQNALALIEHPNATQKDEQLAIDWNAFLNSDIEVYSMYLEYGYLSQTIENLPELNKLQLDKINATNQSILNRLETLANVEMEK